MKRKASRPAPYETPAKLSKRSTSTSVSRKLSTLKRAGTSVRAPMPPPRWPSVRKKAPSLAHTSSLPSPDWPTLVPPSRAGKDAADLSASSTDMTEISEEPPTRVPGLRRLSTLPLEEEEALSRAGSKTLSKTGSKSLSKTGSKSLSKTGSKTLSKTGSKTLSKTGSKTLSKTGSKSLSRQGSSLSGVTAVATLEKKESVITLDTTGTVTTITRLPSGSSVGETTGLSISPPSIRKELSKAAGTASASAFASAFASSKPGSLNKKVSSIRVYGVDAPEEPEASLSRGSSTASKAGSGKRGASLTASSPSTSSPAVPLPPGGLIEIVFSFDTTGSMSTCIDEVRGRVGDMIQRLQADIPGIRIAVIAHGDYCDAESFYVIKWIDFGATIPELCNFVQTISGTGGGDFDECYELVLARAQTELSWTPGSQRSLVMIGDATPHPVSFYSDREEKLNWEEETKKLAAMNVKIYAVQAMNNPTSTAFYRKLATVTRGHHLKLDQFNNIFDMLMVLCYNERGSDLVQAYEDEVRTREGSAGLHKDLEGLFTTFRGGKVSEAAKKVLSKGAAKGKKVVSTKKPTASKAKATGAKSKPKAGTGAKGKGKTAAAAAKGKGSKAKTAGKASAKAAAKKAKGKGVKSVKGRKPATTKAAASKKKKKTKTKSKKRVPGVKRKFREAVPDEELSQGSCMKHVKWTEWVKALVPVKPKPRGRQVWDYYTRGNGRQLMYKRGMCNFTILADHCNAPAIFEVAVQLKAKKRYVVFWKACKTWPQKRMWDSVLISPSYVEEEASNVLFDGGQIWVRRGNVGSAEQLTEAKRHMNKLYDYAWQGRRAGKGRPFRVRRVKKCNKQISGHSNN